MVEKHPIISELLDRVILSKAVLSEAEREQIERDIKINYMRMTSKIKEMLRMGIYDLPIIRDPEDYI